MRRCVNGHKRAPETYKINSQGKMACTVCDKERHSLRRQMEENQRHLHYAGRSEAGQPLYVDDRQPDIAPLPF